MAHNLFSARFFSNSRVPAWHGLGINEEIGISAQQALEKVGAYEVSMQRIFAQHPTDARKRMETDYHSIVRHPVADDNEYRIFGHPVSGDYHLITPKRSAQLFDEGVGNIASVLPYPVETYGVLGQGEEIFITCKTEQWAVKDDEMQNYLYAYFPMYNGKAAVIGFTTVRIVCSNTLAMVLNGRGQRMFTITHRKGCEQLIRDNLASLTAESDDYQHTLREVMVKMSDTQMDDIIAKQTLKYVYPDPMLPEESWVGRFGNDKTFEEYLENYELKRLFAVQTRDTVHALFSGETFTNDAVNKRKVRTSVSTIAGHVATDGTAFGLYNAVAEFESHRRDSSLRHTTVNLIAGDRAKSIRDAYDAVMHYANTGNPLERNHN